MNNTLEQLDATIRARREADPSESWVARLREKGLDEMLKKVGEEATEVVIAAKGEDRQALVNESADLIFHLLVVLAEKGLDSGDVMAELERRFGQSGIAEKAARGQ